MVINVEVQISASPAMAKRILYYLSKLIWEQMKSGDDFSLLRPVICVVICNHPLLSGEDGYMNWYSLLNEVSGNPFTDLVKVLIIELPKVPGQDDGSPVWPWLRYFKCRKAEEFQMLLKKHPEVGGAVVELRKMSWSERRRDRALAKEMWRHDVATWKHYARQEGLAEGKAEVARKLKALGRPAAEIAAATGLAIEEIEKL
jgi:predicted transposase/invertase (TIGR01784 family)